MYFNSALIGARVKFGWPISLILHAGFFIIGTITLSRAFIADPDGRIVPVELVTITDTTNIKAAIKADRPVPSDNDLPMTLQKPMEPAEQSGEASRVAADQPPKPPVSQSAEVQNFDDETLEPSTIPSQKTDPAPSFDLDRIAALVDKSREVQPQAGQQKSLQSEQNFYEYADQARAAAGAGTALTASELDALKSAMYRCWRIPLDAKNPETLLVRVRVRLRADGHVIKAELMDQNAIARSDNPYLPIAAQRAISAVNKCAPYDFLPLEKYSMWQDMTLRFKPDL